MMIGRVNMDTGVICHHKALVCVVLGFKDMSRALGLLLFPKAGRLNLLLLLRGGISNPV